MTRKFGRLAAVAGIGAVAAAFGLGIVPFETEAGALGKRPAAAAQLELEDTHDLAALRLFNRVVLYVKDNYVDPSRIRPKEMLLSALDYVEKSVAEVLVDERQALETGKITLTVGTATRVFDVSEVDSLWQMAYGLKDIFAFVQANLVSTEDTREIEYAAVSGMLATLDPHSNLLTPEQYKDMQMHTRGEFGGLGFVVSMRDGKLTVMKVLKNTPAHKGGILPRDVIQRIGEESTVNMDLTEAVGRLRGKPGSPVSFWVERKSFEKARKFTVTRDIIQIESVDPVKLLADKVGYIQITNFQGNTTRDLRKAIADLEKQAKGKLTGLVLDLRGNPGGLLEQAISVSDLFVSKGNIVSTVGPGGELRERKHASASGTLSELPLVVIVNQGSASASEIVGGAVKNLDRGVVIGHATFGKGSVQVLYDLVDDAALKLTIAQYLTPGDLSIQETGVVPDIQLDPALVSKKRVMVFAPRRSMREKDLEEQLERQVAGAVPGMGTLAHPDDPNAPKPEEFLTFLRDDVPEDEEIDEFEGPEWKEDFQVRFARELIVRAGAPTRSAMLKKAGQVVARRSDAERKRIDDAIRAMGIDWSAAPAGKEAPAPTLSAELSFQGEARGGQKTQVVLKLTNRGDQPLYRVRAWTESETPLHVGYHTLFDRLEFLFGRLNAGETRTWSVDVELPEDLTARTDGVAIHVEADGAAAPEPIAAVLTVDELAAPRFAFSWQLDDSAKGNGDGLLSAGEEVELALRVHNDGPGGALEAIANLKNLENEKVYISKGRHVIGGLAPKASAPATMHLNLKEGYESPVVRLRVTIFDRKIGEFVADEIEIPVVAADRQARREPFAQVVEVGADTSVLAAARAGAGAIGRVAAKTRLAATHRVGRFVRVQWGPKDDRNFGFLPSEQVSAAAGQKPAGEVSPLWAHQAPRIRLENLTSGLTTDQAEIALSGEASDETGLRDVYVFLNNQKVYFKALGGDGKFRLPFHTKIPLAEGPNTVVVFARENDELMSRKTLVVYRHPSAVVQAAAQPAAVPTPAVAD